MTVRLIPVGVHWMKGRPDDGADLCAHGDYEFCIDSEVLAHGAGGRSLTLSAAALCLLRTLERSHTKAAPVGQHLIPCCGSAMYAGNGVSDVTIVGCATGDDYEVERRDGDARILVRAPDGREWRVMHEEWRDAVFAFTDAVSEFYARSLLRRPAPEDAAGYGAFVAEWERRRGRPFDRVRE